MKNKIQFIYSQFTALVMVAIGFITAEHNPGSWMLFALGGAISILAFSQIKSRKKSDVMAIKNAKTQASQ
ncbi:hypothetical protein FLL45_05590 [Aliikangiella marina]|uniref:Uncharacterized protein n=1 Tax=Aliikangiella marina TaxID=1712262 RepID=A0A545TJQ5_9GAMM|nr:hypothetical protein [Aliikangiella marina]TQV77416.1 hypothetical protein FLL45_05590 [Aliikangiella marina]